MAENVRRRLFGQTLEFDVRIDNPLNRPKLGNGNRDWYVVEKLLEPVTFKRTRQIGIAKQVLNLGRAVARCGS
jgi:hypothetical protein